MRFEGGLEVSTKFHDQKPSSPELTSPAHLSSTSKLEPYQIELNERAVDVMKREFTPCVLRRVLVP